jgi:hypothetical protein
MNTLNAKRWDALTDDERAALLRLMHEQEACILTKHPDRTAYNEAHDHMLAACRAMAEHDRRYVSNNSTLPRDEALQTSIMLLARMARTFLEQAYEELATLDAAFGRGWQTYVDGQPGAPALDPWVRDRMKRPVGDPYTYAILSAWLAGNAGAALADEGDE